MSSTQLILTATLAYSKNNVTVNENPGTVSISVGGNGLVSNSAYVATTTDTALPLGSVTVAGGLFFLYNQDLTNQVNIKTAVSGTILTNVKAGEFCLFRLPSGVTAPSIQSVTNSVIVSYALFDN